MLNAMLDDFIGMMLIIGIVVGIPLGLFCVYMKDNHPQKWEEMKEADRRRKKAMGDFAKNAATAAAKAAAKAALESLKK